MSWLVGPILIFLVLGNLVLIGSGRLALGIRVLAAEGIALGLLPLVLPGHEIELQVILLVVVSVALKGVVFPRLLFRAARAADVRHETSPYVGYALSLPVGVVALGLSNWLGTRFGLATPQDSPLLIPTALFTVLVGLFVIVARRTALNQVMGYLTLENGIFLFGITLARDEPFLVEMGVLLDVFAAVFVMGITIFHISREFDHIAVDQLTTLKD
jgi:hydrogenase-4 component E